MEIEIIRSHHSRWAIDGQLRIAGQKICDTSENLQHHIAAGSYSIRIDRCHHYRRKMPIICLEGNTPKVSNRVRSARINKATSFCLEGSTSPCESCKRKHIGSQHANLPTYCPMIKIGNGVMNRTDGSIIIGEHRLSGLIINSSTHYDRLIDRLDKAANRGEEITLTISD